MNEEEHPQEEAMLRALRESSWEFRTQEARHRELEAELAAMVRHRLLTPTEELHKKELQIQKLAAKDRMAELLRDHRRRDAAPPARRASADHAMPPGAQ